MFQFCSRSVLYLFQNLFKICSRLTRSWSRLAVSAPTVEVWAILVLYSETRRSKVTSLSYFWAFICLDWKPAGCSVGFCAQASLVAHFLSPTAHMIPLGTRRQIAVINMYMYVSLENSWRRENINFLLRTCKLFYFLSPLQVLDRHAIYVYAYFTVGNWQYIYEFTNTHNLFLSLIFYNDSCEQLQIARSNMLIC